MDNYFELYGLPQGFRPDAAAVKNKYYELSRRYHPDRFATAADSIRLEALRVAALNNEAYRTFSDADRTMAYVLKLHGILADEEKYNLPPAFLMEMMELNEALSDHEAGTGDGQQQAQRELEEQLQRWEAGVAPLLDRFDAGAQDPELLLQVKDAYFRKKYLLRIGERVAGMTR